MRDGQDRDDDDDDDGGMMRHGNMEPSGFEGRGGALVEEAKKMMQDDDEGPVGGHEGNSGPKIKMNRIGKKKKQATTGQTAGGPGKGPSAGLPDYTPPAKGGAFTE